MRIIGGKYRGKKLIAPSTDKIRPTTDRMRETLFNILEHGTGPGIRGASILDLFAGTGAFGVEALSRGAKHVTFIDNDAQSLKLTRQNVAQIKNEDNCLFVQQDGRKISSKIGEFDVIFMDPPYHKNMILPALQNVHQQNILSDNGIIVVEFASDENIDFTGHFEELKSRKIGDTAFTIIRAAT